MKLQLYGTKLATKQTYQTGKRAPVTEILLEQSTILGTRTQEKHGYNAYIIGLGTEKKKTYEVRSESLSLENGYEFDFSEIFKEDSKVQISGTSKGKGFSGAMKRWGFHGQPKTHGQSDRTRRVGSIGRGTTPGRVVKGKHMPGRMGGETVSVKNLKVISYTPETHLLQIKGIVPGHTKSKLILTVNL